MHLEETLEGRELSECVQTNKLDTQPPHRAQQNERKPAG